MTACCVDESMLVERIQQIAKRIGTNLCTIRVLRSAELPNCQIVSWIWWESKSVRNLQIHALFVCQPKLIVLKNCLQSEDCALFFSPGLAPRRERMVALRKSVRLTRSAVATYMVHVYCTRIWHPWWQPCLWWLESYGFQSTRPLLAKLHSNQLDHLPTRMLF